jgi:DNA segregation ATPase FtsK/SpoIIIE, S-DNA-T family
MKQARKKNKPQSFLTAQMSNRLREGFLLIFCALAVFILVSLISYNPMDPGWTSINSSRVVTNWSGRVGAWFADILFLLLGYVAYILPLTIVYWSLKGFAKAEEEQKTKNHYFISDRVLKGVGLLFLLSSCCGLTHLYLGTHGVNLPAKAGGIIGYLVSEGLANIFNSRGSLIVLLTGFLCGVTLTTGFSWVNLTKNLTAKVRERLHLFWSSLREKFTFKISFSWFKSKKAKPITKMLDWENEQDNERIVEVKIKPQLEAEDAPKKPFKPVIVASRTELKLRKPELAKEKMESAVILKPGSLPPLSLLNPPVHQDVKPFSQIRFDELSQLVEQRLLDFGVEVKVADVLPGPVITRFELELAPGIKVSKITGLAKDIARSLSVASVRVVEVIPGKPVIGLEIANENREVVTLREILESPQYKQIQSPVCLALGKDIAGVPTIVDLAKMPHLLAAGTTGSGKSVSLNAMLLSMLYKATPEELRLILIDPKMLELSIYEGIPHLLTPVITDMKDASNALRWCVIEMDKRYRLMASLGVRNLAGYNAKVKEAINAGNPLTPPDWLLAKDSELTHLQHLPLIVVVADELADMMMVVGKKVEELIVRLAQKARAAGIHLVLATQRPSVDVITGLIKANVPTRIAFQVSSRIDSRTILDQQGAEQLLGHGDMLYLPAGGGIPTRLHGAYVSDEEVHRVVAAWQTYSKPEYLTGITDDVEETNNEGEGGASGETDPLYDQAVRIVTESRRASISLIQRRLRIGYNRAARLMEEMEASGLVSTMDSSGSREVLAEPPPMA